MGFWKKSQIVANYKWAVRGGLRRETEFYGCAEDGYSPRTYYNKDRW